ncbi:hypothetical protein LARI1_G005423 [Lachnellula arida]|uniref:6-phosphogluconate dehydrogenase NADP-binding domain-containing protein n=1 Tax=Lachnellula arida TaxID=1316785 RepID=A0A8T9BA65_9HELO|nr:hypothetical protein LARI1_G005423 [Lachnellula arida]
MTSHDLATSMEGFVIGIIGMGDMGKMYAKRLSDAGWRFNHDMLLTGTDSMSLGSTPATEKRNTRVCVKSLQIE